MPNKKALKKQEFDSSALFAELSSSTEYKDQEYLDCGEAFSEVAGLPLAIGHLNMFIGHSDSGKTAALIKSMIASQQMGRLPVLIITEEKWSFNHAKLMGFDVEEETPNKWIGHFIFRDDFDYVEQITDFINLMLDKQKKGELPYDLDFFWDSVGSVPCKLTFDGKGGKQHTAGVLSDKIGMGLNRRITSSRKKNSPYTNSLNIVVQPWVYINMSNPMAKPKIKGKGGNAIWLNSTIVFQFGNVENSDTSAISATKQGRKIRYATRTKVSIIKNHINGLGYLDGKIIITPHDFILDTDAAINKYKKDYSEYWMEILDGDFELVDETDTPAERLNKEIFGLNKSEEDEPSDD